MKKCGKSSIAVISFILALTMAFGVFQPMNVAAEDGDTLTLGASGEIIAFAEIEDAITVSLGTLEADLPLPKTLTATVRFPKTATPTELAGTEADVDVPVTWKIKEEAKAYDGNVAGEYLFVAVVGDNYTLATTLPEIAVTITNVAAVSLMSSSVGKFLAPIDPPVAGSIPISTRAQLEAIKDNLSGNYHLTQDIDLSGADWVPIGTSSEPFAGIFDGQGHIIKNLTINSQMSYAGLFGNVRFALLENVALENTAIDVSYTSQPIYAGGICGFASYTSIVNCNNAGNINIIPAIFNDAKVGGIVGYCMDFNSIDYCYNSSSVTIYSSDTAQTHYNELFVGGIIGQLYSTSGDSQSVDNCYNAGDVSAYHGQNIYAGGIYGQDLNCNHLVTRNCYNTGNVASDNARNVSAAGGICSMTAGSIEQCYNTGVVTVSTTSSSFAIGAICGDTASINNCYCLNLYGSVFGTQLTDAQMRSQANFVGFDFETVWVMPSDGGYPVFKSQDDGGDEGKLYIKSVTSPAGAVLTNQAQSGGIDGTITATVNNVTSQLIDIVPSIDSATWALYHYDEQLQYVKLDNKYLPLKPGENNAFIELEAQGYNKLIYSITITQNTTNPGALSRRPITFYESVSSKEINMDIVWGWDLFKSDNTTYNNSLAIAGLALSGAVEYSYPFASQVLRELDIKPSFANQTKHAVEHYDYHFGAISTAHTIALQEVTIDGKSHNLIIIITRGTSGWEDAIVDVAPGGAALSANNVIGNLERFLSNNGVNLNDPNNKFFVTGHSLGGATANIVGEHLSRTVSKSNTYVYTFASFKTSYTKGDWGNIFNIINKEDMVPPHSPLTILRYGKDIEFHRNEPELSNIDEEFISLTGKTLSSIMDAQTIWIWEGIRQDKTKFLTAHSTTTYMAYLLSRPEVYELRRYNIRVASFKCPVDIEVYNSTGNLVGRVIDNIPEYTDVFIHVVGDEKYVYMPLDDLYTFKILSTDIGTMDYESYEQSLESGEQTTSKLFSSVRLATGKQMYSETGDNIDVLDTKLYVIDSNGTKIAEIQTDGTEIPIDNSNGANPQWPAPQPIPSYPYTPDRSTSSSVSRSSSASSGSSGSNSSSPFSKIAPKEQWLDADTATKYAKEAEGKAQDYVRTRYTGIQGVRAVAWAELSGKRYEHDTMDGKAVQVRIFIDKPESFTKDALVSGYIKDVAVDKTRKLFEKWFSNKIRVIHLDQQIDWEQPVQIAAKADLSGMDTKNLHFYSYNKTTNSYRRIFSPAYWFDANGYLRFTTPYAGDIIISEGAFARK